jgi:hypothetical protein
MDFHGRPRLRGGTSGGYRTTHFGRSNPRRVNPNRRVTRSALSAFEFDATRPIQFLRVVKYARSRLSESRYRLLTNNSSTAAARRCATSVAISKPNGIAHCTMRCGLWLPQSSRATASRDRVHASVDAIRAAAPLPEPARHLRHAAIRGSFCSMLRALRPACPKRIAAAWR